MANFRTKARAIDLLGKNQIADLPTSISELWKNGYDAYGDRFHADLYCKGYKDVEQEIFLIKDDGHGMSYEDIINKWIVLGTDSKKSQIINLNEQDKLGKEQRVSLGEKGIGRLSSAFLGNHMLLITKKENDDFQMLFINWQIGENYNAFLEELEIPVASFNQIKDLQLVYTQLQNEFKNNLKLDSWNHDMLLLQIKTNIESDLNNYKIIPSAILDDISEWYKKFKHGTIFVVFNPITELKNLADKISTDISDTEYLTSALSGLFNPFEDEFKKYLDTDNDTGAKIYIYKEDYTVDFLATKEFFTKDDLVNCEHWIDGNFDDFGCFTGNIKVDTEVIEYIWKPNRLPKETDYKNFKIKLAFIEGSEVISSLSPEQYSIYKRKLDSFSGLLIYRDGFRVLPYGKLDADFLEFEQRRSMSAGLHYFSHRKMFGYIALSKEENPSLYDKAGREGLTSNKAYKEFKRDLIEFFETLAKEYYGTDSELKKTRDQRREEKKKLKEYEKNEIENRKRLQAEKKKTKIQLDIFRKDLKENYAILKELIINCMKFENDLNAIISMECINELDEVGFFYKLENFEKRFLKLKIIRPEGVLLTDKDIDRFYSYGEEYQEGKDILKRLNYILRCNTQISRLVNSYLVKKKNFSNEIVNDKQTSIGNISENFNEIINNIKSQYSKYEIGLKSMSKVDINDKPGIVRSKLIELDQIVSDYNEEKVYLERTRDFFANMSYQKNNIELFYIYKNEYTKLEKKVNELQELAQLGISIELIDHQFNVLYGNIHKRLVEMGDKIKPDEKEIFSSLKTSFEHLERNHKLLVPLYRTMRRSKRMINGRDIKKTILDFYEISFKKEDIEFKTTDNFINYSVNTFESIIMPVYINIINNALYWIRSTEKKIISLDVNENGEVLIINSGKKMSFTELDRCFELFYSKKPSGRGMGLYLARTNLRTVGLDIYATNDKEYNKFEGACFVITSYRGENNEL